MPPITNRSEAQTGGFAQVRAALTKFEGTVESAEWGEYPAKHNDEGELIPAKEYLDIVCVDNVPIEVTEELSMDISESWSHRQNCSNFAGSFWVEKFLLSAEEHKVLIPDGLIGKRIVWEKETLEASDPKFNSTNYIIKEVKGAQAAAKPAIKPAAKKTTIPPAEAEAPEVEAPADADEDLMGAAAELAVGKTLAQFKTAVGLDPQFKDSPLLSLAKSGMLTMALVNDGKLTVVGEGDSATFALPE